MSRFGEIFEQMGTPTLLDHLGEPVTYTPAGGASKPIAQAICGEITDRYEDFGDGTYRIRERNVTIPTDATTGITNPLRGDAVTISAVEWRVEEVMQPTSTGLVELRLKRLDLVEKSGAGHRIRR